MTSFVTVAGFGVVVAAILGVACVGLTLQFGVTNYINFAYGAFITFGAYACYLLTRPPLRLNLAAAVICGAAATAMLAFLMHRLVFSPFIARRPQLLFALIVTYVCSFMLDDIYDVIFGTSYHQMPTFLPTTDSFVAGPLTIQVNQLLYLAIALVAMGMVQYLLSRTKLGRSMRAMADDSTLATACGLNTKAIIDVTWIITGALAGVAGAVLAMQTGTFNINLGDLYVFLVFAAVIVGGIGRAYGALIGALIIGLGSQLSVLVVPSDVTLAVTFGILVVVMIVRPQGLLGGSRLAFMER